MNQPHSVCAVLDQVPYIAPAGVRTPRPDPRAGCVRQAPSSRSTGAAWLRPRPWGGQPAGPDAGGSHGAYDRPHSAVYFVSPQQINAQLPSGLAAGAYSLTVHWEGHDDVQAAFQVVRDAPGLFTEASGGVQYALVTRPNGALATPSAPRFPEDRYPLWHRLWSLPRLDASDGFAVPRSSICP